MRPDGRRRGRHQGSEDHGDAMRACSSRPFCSCDSRRVSLWYLSAGLRYTTQRGAQAARGKGRLNFLLCCRCCQALLHIFSSPHSLGSVSHRPEPSGGFFGAQTSRLQCPSTRADADTINTGCHFPTTEMRETTGDLRWDRVRVHLLCLTVENAIDRATGGKRLDAALPEMVANHASADRARPVWR